MPTKRGNRYYVKRRIPGVGNVYRTLNTASKTLARKQEDMLLALAQQGLGHLVRAWLDGRIELHGLVEHYETGRLHELAQELRREDAPLREAIEAALRYKEPDVRSSTLQRYETGLAHFERFCANQHGSSVTVREALDTDNVQDFKGARLREGAKRETVNNDLQSVSILATRSLEKGWIKERPKVKRFKSAVRIRYLEKDEIPSYMAALRGPFRPMFQLLLGTGIRLGEAENLAFRDMKFSERGTRALIEDSKTAEGVRPVFVPDWVADTLRGHIEPLGLTGSDPLFSIPRRTVQKEHGRACELVGISGYTIHDHRHTAAVHLARCGMPLHLLQEQLGHARIDMTMRYARFHPDYGDVSAYFERVGEEWGVVSAGNSSGNTTSESTEQAAA